MSVINKRKVTCSGCNACAEACPKHCIEMVPDRKGFLYPKVNEVVCIDCGVCERVCPFEDGNKKLNVPLTAYAAWNKDNACQCQMNHQRCGKGFFQAFHIATSKLKCQKTAYRSRQ